MRWLKHFSDARRNPKLLRIEKKLGEAGYARAFKLFEIVAERGGTGEHFDPRLDLNLTATDLDWLADEWGVPSAEAKDTLDLFAAVRLIDPDKWGQQFISIPQMLEHRDAYTDKRQRGKYVQCTDNVRPVYGQSPQEVEAEGKGKAKSEKPVPSALPAWLPLPAWEDFKAMRRKMRAPLTAGAEYRILKRLDALRAAGHNPAEVLDVSIERSWRGVFPLKSAPATFQADHEDDGVLTIDRIRPKEL